jgi:hypothetical protein
VRLCRGSFFVFGLCPGLGADVHVSPPYRVNGGPSWLGSTRFDVLAKAPAGANSETAKAMLQALLADRFGQRCLNTTMAELAENLSQWAPAYADHPIIDSTGLTGGYDFVVYWTPRGVLQAPRPNDPNQPPGSAVGAADPGGYSLFEAVDKELGLKLELQKGKIKVMVIDHIEQTPQ